MKEPRHFPPIPNGWFAVAWSDDLARRQVLPLRCFGRDLVLYRSASGVASVLSRYCPHLGASLAHGGTVEGETLRCPFHGWKFDGAGTCREAPRTERIPPKAQLTAWPTAEVNGLIHVYHHAENAPPPALPPAFEPLNDAQFVRIGRSTFSLASHPQELSENAFDAAHFPTVHRTTYPEISASEEGTAFSVSFRTQPMLGSRALPLHSRIDITCFELGLVRVNVQLAPWVNVFVFSYAAPTEEEQVQVRHVWVTEAGRGAAGLVRRAAGWVAGRESMRQARQDRVIWENKIHRTHPALGSGDRALGTFRRWARQFYGRVDEAARRGDVFVENIQESRNL
jgi:nitrite reductase/ring-hydroxylating ferredoxin subunit